MSTANATADENSRRSFRVSERVYLDYDVINEREYRNGLSHLKLRRGGSGGIRSTLIDLNARFDEKLFVLRNESSRVAECFSILNDKINAVIEQLPDMQESRASLAQSDPITCDIGADGMAFPCREALDDGSKLFLRFLIESDKRYIETFAHVVRRVEPPGKTDEKYPHGVAVEFNGMPAAQKEMLIQHMFSRESESLRIRRLELDSAEFDV